MAFSYDPNDAAECLPEGEYDAELMSVTEKTSKAGNPMLEVVWSVPREDRVWSVRDYVVQPATLFKLKQIARAWGMLDQFQASTFDLSDHAGKPIRLYLTVQSQDGYPDRNQVNGYKEAALAAKPQPKSEARPADSEIPF